ncbi:MAG: ATP-binding cassette domain-containing protein, partial [Saprospiraceae bacterium]
MNYLTLENVTKSYGEKVLFENISLHVDQGQKIAIVAKNGTGKSTLLRVIAGIEGSEGENSKILLRKDIRIGFLNQEPDFQDDHTIMEAVFDSENALIHCVNNYDKALALPEMHEALQSPLLQMYDWTA